MIISETFLFDDTPSGENDLDHRLPRTQLRERAKAARNQWSFRKLFNAVWENTLMQYTYYKLHVANRKPNNE